MADDTKKAGDDLKAGALEYHRQPRPGKLAIVATKPLASHSIGARSFWIPVEG